MRVNTENTLQTIRAEVTRLSELFGTQARARAWLAEFETEYNSLRTELRARLGNNRLVVVAHLFMSPWAAFAGLTPGGTYGPAPMNAEKLRELTALRPNLILANAYTRGEGALVEANPSAKVVLLVNFPGEGQGLLEIFRIGAVPDS